MNNFIIWDELISMLPIILCGCVLPIIFIWMETRRKMNETNARTQIVTAALEKNPDMDVEELLKKISPKKKLLKEKLNTAGISRIDIQRAGAKLHVSVYTAKPGIVIGKGGTGVEALKKELVWRYPEMEVRVAKTQVSALPTPTLSSWPRTSPSSWRSASASAAP